MSARLIVGCGYLGKRVAERWRALGERVFATTRSAARAEELRRAGLEPVVCDVLDPASLPGLPETATIVYCVGLDRSSGVPKRNVYVDGLANVLAALGERSARLVYVSSTGVYGQSQGEWVDEASATEPAEESGRVMLEAEGVLRRRRPEAVVLRFAGIYGPGRLLRAREVRAGTPLAGDPEKWLNLIHVEDGAEAVLAAAQGGGPGEVYNVADGSPCRRREFFAELARLLGAPAPVFAPPGAGTAQEAANRRVASAKLCRELGVRPRYPTFREGLAQAVSADEAGGGRG